MQFEHTIIFIYILSNTINKFTFFGSEVTCPIGLIKLSSQKNYNIIPLKMALSNLNQNNDIFGSKKAWKEVKAFLKVDVLIISA